MKLITTGYPLPLSKPMIEVMETELNHSPVNGRSSSTFRFVDPNYTPDKGGFHPVEIRLVKGRIQSITDFAYIGSGSYVELAIELDFAFAKGVFQQFGVNYPIQQGHSLFEIWQENFCTYYGMGIFKVMTPAEKWVAELIQ